MTASWPTVHLGKTLTRRKEEVLVDDLDTYKRLTVRLNGKGIVVRDELEGSRIGTKRQFRVRQGQLLLSKIDARNGAFGIVPSEADGAVITGNFWAFDIDERRVEPRFFYYLTTTPSFVDFCVRSSEGTTNRRYLQEPVFLAQPVALPMLHEQRRIVALLDELAALIGEAQELRAKAREEAEALPFEAFHDLASRGIANGWAPQPLSEVCEINPSRKGRTNYSDDMQVSFVPMSAVDHATGSIAWPEARSFWEVKKGYKWFLEGDVIFARITPCMQNGKSAIARGLINRVGFGSTEFHVLRPREKVTAEWIHCIVRQPSFRRDAGASFKGSAGQQRVPRAFLESYEVPVPSLDEQMRIVAYVDSLHAQVDEVTALQDATQVELDALLPAVLDRAFKGEL